MVTISEITNTPIIRPVAVMDKLKIVEVAEQIDTFNLSIQPFEDYCMIFAPPQSRARPQPKKVHQYEERLAINEMIQWALVDLRMKKIQVESSNEKTEELSELL